MNGPMEAGGAMFRAFSSMFFVMSVDLLSQTFTKWCFGRMPPAPAPERLRSAGQNGFASLISIVLPLSLDRMPVTPSALPST